MSNLTFPELKETEGKIAAARKKLHDIFIEAGPEMDMAKVKSVDGDNAAKVDAIRSLNEELSDLGRKRDDLVELRKGAEVARDYNPEDISDEPAPGHKGSIGAQFKGSAAYMQKGQAASLDVDLKTLMTTAAGWAPESLRSGLVVANAQRPVQVTDLLPTIPTGQAVYKYMEETTFTNNAAEAAEGGTFGEAAIVFTERSSLVQKIPVFIPVTDEQLEDEEGVAPWLDMRLPFMIRQRLDSQILVGNGTTPNLRGVNNVVGIQTQAKGVDPVFDAIYKGLVLVQTVGYAAPNACVIHPLDWQDIRLTRTIDGIYILGNPSDPGPDRIWGVTVVQTAAQTQNTAVVGDFANYSLLAVKRGIDVQVSNSHSTFFVEGKQAIRADMRCAVAFTRPTAFCTVTDI